MTIPRFELTASDPLVRGRELGSAARTQVQATWEGYERLFAAAGADVALRRSVAERGLEQTHAWAPELAGEIAGIALGAGLETWQVAALNARTELLAAARARTAGECSTFVVVPREGGPPRTIQTWDWYDHLRHGIVALRLEPRPGHVVELFSEFGVVGKIGVNSAGLGLHFNILGHDRDGGETGVPVHVIARRILDLATTVEEATTIARSARVSASTVLTVVAWDGERAGARGLELSPAGVAELEPDGDGVLLHTNHFLDARLAAGERMGRVDSTTYPRLAELRGRSARLVAAADEGERAAALLDHDGGPGLCCHPAADAPFDERWETLATISLDLAGGRLRLHEGGPCAVAAWA
ncbi:C45 family peptidase [Conexibacter stalactiti]|uniref:C45 family peptidase n=1 Tax=Conexibacter stalactiti TaxID=1940611 RepID=A0ABU4HS35_9ACTN|nr:C45 family peptidase [Conexibacter stalactiti]MDW5596125.1 C45 family peptidase [Conexibacter stalactiti]MEC5036767.1 C45 family peptidase [Conexibacter stalactiti]